MKRWMIFICAAALTVSMLTGCAKRAAEDAKDAVSSAASEMKEDADKYGKIDGETKATIAENTSAPEPTTSNMDEMLENGKIDDDNDDPTDGDNIDDDEAEETPDDDSGDDTDGGEHNDETMNDGSNFI